MAITATVCRLRDESLSLSLAGGSSPRISTNWETKWEVVFSGADDPSDVDSVMASSWSGVPRIGQTVFVNSQGLILPFVLARSKSVERDGANAYRFLISVSYDDESDSNTESQPEAAPSDPENIPPRINWTAAGGEETAWMEARLGGEEKPCLLPTGSLYASPTVRKVPVLNAAVTVYDNTFTLDELQSRMFICNSKSWQGFAAYQAMITDIKWSQVDMPIAGTPGLTRRTYKVVYTVSCKQYKI